MLVGLALELEDETVEEDVEADGASVEVNTAGVCSFAAAAAAAARDLSRVEVRVGVADGPGGGDGDDGATSGGGADW